MAATAAMASVAATTTLLYFYYLNNVCYNCWCYCLLLLLLLWHLIQQCTADLHYPLEKYNLVCVVTNYFCV